MFAKNDSHRRSQGCSRHRCTPRPRNDFGVIYRESCMCTPCRGRKSISEDILLDRAGLQGGTGVVNLALQRVYWGRRLKKGRLLFEEKKCTPEKILVKLLAVAGDKISWNNKRTLQKHLLAAYTFFDSFFIQALILCSCSMKRLCRGTDGIASCNTVVCLLISSFHPSFPSDSAFHPPHLCGLCITLCPYGTEVTCVSLSRRLDVACRLTRFNRSVLSNYAALPLAPMCHPSSSSLRRIEIGSDNNARCFRGCMAPRMRSPETRCPRPLKIEWPLVYILSECLMMSMNQTMILVFTSKWRFCIESDFKILLCVSVSFFFI